MQVPLFDAHCDSLTAPGSLRHCPDRQLDLARLAGYTPAAQVFAVWTQPETATPDFLHCTLDRFHAELDCPDSALHLCRNVQEIRTAAADGKIAAVLAAEGAELVGCTTDGLHAAFARGLRVLTLTWNHSNALAGAAADHGGGLTPAGRDFVPYAQRLGVAIDLSHSSEQTFWDVLEVAQRPVFASHSNSRALADHCRNLTDCQFCALVTAGGCAGLNLYPDFLGLSRDLDAAVAHIEHFLALGGERAVCLGCDFDGMGSHAADSLSRVEHLPRLYEALLRRNWSETLIQDIFYNNLFNYMERAL